MAVNYERIILRLSVEGSSRGIEIKQMIKQWGAAGAGEKEIMDRLTVDFSPGGSLFESLSKQFGLSTGAIGDYVSIEQVHDEWVGPDAWRWITTGDDKRCPDCIQRDGKVRTWDEWEAMGLPGTELNVCTWRCRCVLEPQEIPMGEVQKGIEKNVGGT